MYVHVLGNFVTTLLEYINKSCGSSYDNDAALSCFDKIHVLLAYYSNSTHGYKFRVQHYDITAVVGSCKFIRKQLNALKSIFKLMTY